MNNQELVNKIDQLPSHLIDKKVVISKDSVVELVKQLDCTPGQEKYTVKMKNVCHPDLGYNIMHGVYSFYNREHNHSGIRYKHTKSQLEKAGLSGVFGNSMFEVEEIE
ncbi:hypothetical protein [Streptococcus acidominimus]|uniref:Phage protein n=1 Tax=Streptococcus acidominimus TaxID=1326 RepID=A0A1Q8EFU8_STRAI|nr:hypothetical protein [Streptococcus acidominimus]MBF0848954.1 hypothetical protein [Streptococcus danieliae]QBX13662.1 hypothetical protein Javan1_0022 [Streptococcus phage Javan1]MBF0818729.1 hypothetical protein [Streptococcus acidominimus]MBF0838327.1 hypothetical protein [Streptococcus acidominimus]OLF50639.1 hypothetical protein BU200_01040 [Streptococcus acidominimus]